MRISRFVSHLPFLFDDLCQSDHPRDRLLLPICQAVEGMATENKLALLNLAVSLLEEGEMYLEVGSWKGLSLIGAMWKNEHKSFIAIDNFSEFGGSEETLRGNLARYQMEKQGTLVNGDFLEVLSSGVVPPTRVGVFLYDGNHSFASQYQALLRVMPFLADGALVIVDDTSHYRVRAANALFVASHPEFTLLFDIPSKYNGEPRWWNGIQVYSFCRKDPEGHLSRVRIWRDAGLYATSRVWYDIIVTPVHQVLRRIRARLAHGLTCLVGGRHK